MRQLILALKLILALAVLSGVAVAFDPVWRIPGGIAVGFVVCGCGGLIYILEYRKDSKAAELQATADKERKRFQDRTTETGGRILEGVSEIKDGLERRETNYAEHKRYELAGKVMHLANQVAKRLRELRANIQTNDEDYSMREEINRIGGEFDSAILEAATYFPKLPELKIPIVRVKDDVFEAWRELNDWHLRRYPKRDEQIAADFDKYWPIAHFNDGENDETTMRIRKAVADIREELAAFL